MRVVFMGTDKFAVPSLEAVIKSGVDLITVVTQPDQPKGRGLKLSFSPVKECALSYNIPVCQPEKVRDKNFVEKVRNEFQPNLIIVVAFGQILPKSILDIPNFGCINIHPSLLPKYRGASPIQRAIMNGESETGVTLMFMDEGEDTGDIIFQERVPIGITETSESLSEKLAKIAGQMLLKILKNEDGSTVESLNLPRYPQDHSQATYAPKLSKEDGLIDWNKSAFEIHNIIRGTIPWPGAYTEFNSTSGKKMLKIWDSNLSDLPQNIDAVPGTIIGLTKESGIVIATGNGSLIANTVQPADKSKMRVRDFMNGYRIKIGDKLG
ncbi:MAG: methionyl-tRNA formyltransferase [Candidatus Poribacteria bacterium]